VIGYETKLQYPFPKEYGHILQDTKQYIELPLDINDQEVKRLKTEFKDIRENKSYILSNVAAILSRFTYTPIYVLYNILHKGIEYRHIKIELIRMPPNTDMVDARIENDSKDPNIHINKDLMNLLKSRNNYYRVSSKSSFLEDFRNALDSEEISVFYITTRYTANRHANAIVVHPRYNRIYHIEPHGGGRANTFITNVLRHIAYNHTKQSWSIEFNFQIQGDDLFCASWVHMCVAMIIANPCKNGIDLITSLMSDPAYLIRYTMLMLWLFYVRERLTQGDRTVKYYLNPDNKDTVIGEYKKHYSDYTNDEIEQRYIDDMPIMEEISSLLDANDIAHSMFNINENFLKNRDR